MWSGAKFRRFTGREIVAASLIGWLFTLYDGIKVRSWLLRSVAPWRASSATEKTWTGTVVSSAVRSWARVPITTMAPTSKGLTVRVKFRTVSRPAFTSTPRWVPVTKPRISALSV